MSTKTQKIVAAITATALAASVMLGGTLAWQSINQEATNIVSGTINPGGRLHDDFDGNNRNKDIYVENFADQEIYARIQLREYLEIGTTEPGTTTDSLVIPSGANHDATATGAVDTWAIHYFDETQNATDQYVDFTWGGMTTYLPTFNMNKDSLLADINGTYEGLTPDNLSATDDDEADRYSDYIDYATQYTSGVTGYEVWDADLDDEDEVGENVDTLITLTDSAGTTHGTFQAAAESFLTTPGDYTTSFTEVIKDQPNAATHIPTTTLDATVISMADWQAMDPADQAVFFGWVYDVDGWAYWSQPIEPKTVDTATNEVTSDNTTGLLLDAINPRIDDNYYYQIHVIAQFITANDLGHTDGTGFFAAGKGTEPSADALDLLNTIGVNITGGTDLTLTTADATAKRGGTVTFTAAEADGTAVTGAKWLVNGSNVAATMSTELQTVTAIEDGTLTISKNETASTLTVIAIAEKRTLDDDGNVTAIDTLIGNYEVKIVDNYGVTVTAADDATTVDVGDSLQFNAAVMQNGEENTTSGVTWSVTELDGVSISDSGLLSVGYTLEQDTPITVTATSKADSSVSHSVTVTVENTLTDTQKTIATAAEGTKVAIEGTEYWVVAQDTAEERALLWKATPVGQTTGTNGTTMLFDDASPAWKDSQMQNYLNTTYLNSLPTELKKSIKPTTIKTANDYLRSGDYVETTDSVFLLTEADVLGKYYSYYSDDWENNPGVDEYTYVRGNTPAAIVTTDMIGWTLGSGTTLQYAWLRSPRFNTASVALVGSDGEVNNNNYNYSYYVRPAFWVSLDDIYTVTVTAADDALTVAGDKTLQFSAAVTKNGETYTPDNLVWSVDAGTTGSTIDPKSGLLTAGTTTGEVTVKATVEDTTGEYKVTVTLTETQQNIVDAAEGGTVSINGADYWVVVKDTSNGQNRALMWAAAPVKLEKDGSVTAVEYSASDNMWGTSSLRTTLNSAAFKETLGEIADDLIETPITTAKEYNRTGIETDYETTNDSVFLLSEADLTGCVWDGSVDVATSDAREYTYAADPDNPVALVTRSMWAWTATSGTESAWLRSPRANDHSVAVVISNGNVSNYAWGADSVYVRPAFWVNLAS